MKSEEPTFWRGFSLACVRPPRASRPQDEARAIFLIVRPWVLLANPRCLDFSQCCFSFLVQMLAIFRYTKSIFMSHYFQHRDFYNNVVQLSEDYQKDPIVFLEKFFSDYHLVDLRSFQDEMLETCLTTDCPPFDNPEKRADTILLHKNIELLFEAAFLILKKGSSIDENKNQKDAGTDK